jgi:hypothetical protein
MASQAGFAGDAQGYRAAADAMRLAGEGRDLATQEE